MESNDKKVIDFTEKFKNQKELREYAKAQFVTLLSANARIKTLEAENDRLQQQVDALSSKSDLLPKTTEENLCSIELNRLLEVAKGRAMTLEETKRMDLLVKNLYLAKGKNPPEKPKEDKSLDEGALMKFAVLPDGSELN